MMRKAAVIVTHSINFVSNVGDIAVEAVDGIIHPNRRKIYWPSLKASKTKAKGAAEVENREYIRTP